MHKHLLCLLIIFALAIVANCSSLVAQASSAENIAIVGQSAPAFTLEDYAGETCKLSKYRGKFVVLEWVNFDCPFSRKHYESGNIPLLQKKYVKQGVIWLSINSSAPGKQGNFASDKIKEELRAYKAVPTAYLVDPDGVVGHLYGAKTTPAMYVISPGGILIYTGAIDDKPTFDKDDIRSAKNYVKDALDKALAGKPVEIAQTKSYGCSVKYAY